MPMGCEIHIPSIRGAGDKARWCPGLQLCGTGVDICPPFLWGPSLVTYEFSGTPSPVEDAEGGGSLFPRHPLCSPIPVRQWSGPWADFLNLPACWEPGAGDTEVTSSENHFTESTMVQGGHSPAGEVCKAGRPQERYVHC
jgi:hypothetical protein